MAPMNASVIGWANRSGGVWYPTDGSLKDLGTFPAGTGSCKASCPTHGENSTVSTSNKYTVIIAVKMPSDSNIDSISSVSITFKAAKGESRAEPLYGSLRTVFWTEGSSSGDTLSTYREDSIGSERSVSDCPVGYNNATAVTMTFSGSLSKGSTYYLYLYTKDNLYSIYDIVSGSENFSATVNYSVKSYSVTYDANGGVGAPSSQSKPYDGVVYLSTVTPTKGETDEGKYVVSFIANPGVCDVQTLDAKIIKSYEFGYWNTEPDGSGITYTPGSSYAGNNNLKLYAIYTGTTATQNVELPTPVRNGYEFIGWSTNKDAMSGITGTYEPEGDTKFYAIWKANGLLYIFDGTEFSAYQVFIYDGASWDLYCPYVYDSGWSLCS